MIATTLRPSAHPQPTASPAARTQVLRTRSALHELIRRIEAVNAADYDDGARPVSHLESLTRSLIIDARAVLDDVAVLYERAGRGRSAVRIVDLASIGRMELSNFADAILRSKGEAWQRIAACDSARQVGRRCLRVVDDLVADYEQLPRAPDDAAAEEAFALEVRRVFVDLHRTVMGDGLPDSGTIRARIRAAGNGIARALGRDAAPRLRVHDRHMMRAFLRRIREALTDHTPGDAAADRLLRLWEDLSGFTSLLLNVNKREELRLHDRRVIQESVARLTAELPPGAPAPADVLDALRACDGRDPELDEALARGASVEALRACLERVGDALAAACARPLQANSGTWTALL